ncbi:MAG: DUF3857 domain-containing protein [Bacteroidales bacterium]
MRKSILLLFLCILFGSSPYCIAQDFSTKFGKVTNNELTLQSYLPDTSANAIYLLRKCKMEYVYMQGFQLNYEVEVKVKVLKPAGSEYANITIPYFTDESITGISATTYNFENGKTIKTKLDKKYIFEEKVSEHLSHKKFSIPAVKEGSVFEYKYIVRSTDYKPRNWLFQQDIPVKYSQLDFIYPEYYIFNIETRGGYPIEVNHQKTTATFTISGETTRSETYSCQAFYGTYIANDLPALKNDEPYLWYPDDYKSQLSFELEATHFPGYSYKPFGATWESIDELLLKDAIFGRNLTIKNPFEEEVKVISTQEITMEEKIEAIFDVVKKNMDWNNDYRIGTDNLKSAIKNKTGTNAEINFIFMAALRDARIASFPAVMSRRNKGMIPLAIPSVSCLNTFIVAIPKDSSIYYLDGSMEKPWFNELPPVLRTDRARLVDITNKFNTPQIKYIHTTALSNISDKWVNLSHISRAHAISHIAATINKENKITGMCRLTKTGILHLNNQNKYKKAKDSIEYLEDLEKELQLNVKTYSRKSEGTRLQEEFDFEKEPEMSANQMIYINPMVLTHLSKNILKQEERRLPVEFSNLTTYRQTVLFTIPNGFSVEELPASAKLTTADGSCELVYHIVNQGQTIQVNYIYKLNRIFFGADEYNELKTFFGKMAERNKDMIVLRKSQI